jgi:hypothetical protein
MISILQSKDIDWQIGLKTSPEDSKMAARGRKQKATLL